MKKKCTNSKCRKVFTIAGNNNVMCPFCGKKYPRLVLSNKKEDSKNEKNIIRKIEEENREGIIICGLKNARTTSSSDMRKRIMAIQKWTNLSLKESKEVLENIPSFIDKEILLKKHQQIFLSEEKALKHNVVSFVTELEEAGCKCIIV